MQPFNLIGEEITARCITCLVYELVIFGLFAFGVLWIKHYVARSTGGLIATKLLGVTLAVPVGNVAGRIFVGFFANFDERAKSVILIIFIAICIFVCLSLVAERTKPGSPPPAPPPAPGAVP